MYKHTYIYTYRYFFFLSFFFPHPPPPDWGYIYMYSFPYLPHSFPTPLLPNPPTVRLEANPQNPQSPESPESPIPQVLKIPNPPSPQNPQSPESPESSIPTIPKIPNPPSPQNPQSTGSPHPPGLSGGLVAEELPYILKVDSSNPTVTAGTGMGGGVLELVRVGRAGVAGVVERITKGSKMRGYK